MAEDKRKVCFVISPIGDEGSPDRDRANQTLDHLITPVAHTEFGYQVVRSDKIADPGIITKQIIGYLLGAELVVANLTDHNPNVFYELAIRHAAKKPVVQLIEDGQRIPFDVAPLRTIKVKDSWGGLEHAKAALREQIKAVEQDPSKADNPVADYGVDLALRESGNLVEQSLADIKAAIQEVLANQRLVLREVAGETVTVTGGGSGEANSSGPFENLVTMPDEFWRAFIEEWQRSPGGRRGATPRVTGGRTASEIKRSPSEDASP